MRNYLTLTGEDETNLLHANNVVYAGELRYDSTRLSDDILLLDSFWEQLDLLVEYNDLSVQFYISMVLG